MRAKSFAGIRSKLNFYKIALGNDTLHAGGFKKELNVTIHFYLLRYRNNPVNMIGNRRHFLLNSVRVLFLQLALVTGVSVANNNGQEALFYSIESASLIGNVTMLKRTRSEQDCAFLCLRTYPRNCFSFNFGRIASNELHTCELSNSERTLEPHKIHRRKGFDYFGLESVVSRLLEYEPLWVVTYAFFTKPFVIGCVSNVIIRMLIKMFLSLFYFGLLA